MRALASWVSTVVFLPAFGLVLVVFDVGQRVARLFGQRPHEYVAGALQVALVGTFRAFAGTRLEVERVPGVEPWASYIFVSNHQSMFDIPILGTLLFSNFPKYVSKRSLGRWIPSVSYNLRRGGHVLIDRSDAPQAVAAIRDLGERVARGGPSASIFPEGTRARRGELGQFRRAGLMALLDAAPNTPVVPVTLDNSWRLLAHNFLPVPWGVRIRVRIDAPIARRPDEDRERLVEQVRTTMEDALARWRGDSLSPPSEASAASA